MDESTTQSIRTSAPPPPTDELKLFRESAPESHGKNLEPVSNHSLAPLSKEGPDERLLFPADR
jgi:hypothetical protein